jgi:hypothetical protein
MQASSLRSNWDLRNMGILNFNQINAFRLNSFHQLDLRVDKKYFFDRWNLNWYFDIQNAYNFRAQQPDLLLPVRDDAGAPVVNPDDPNRYLLRAVANPAGTILPTIGIIVEF